MKWQLQFSYLNSFDCQITAVYWNNVTFASQNLVNEINLRMCVNFLTRVNLLTH